MSKIIRLIDRTRTVADWKCPRARYWGYEFEGRGVVKNSTGLELTMGIILHDALAAIATLVLNDKHVDIDAIASTAYFQLYDQLMQPDDSLVPEDERREFAREQGTLVEGLIRGFHKHVWPKLLQLYPKIICVEQEMEYPLSQSPEADFIFMTKPDLIMEDHEGNLVYIEYKSTSSKKDTWVNSWETAVQLHSSVKATEHSLGKLPSAVQIVGLYKGYESYGKQSSPFCYAYKKSGNPPFTQDAIQYEYKAGFKRIPTWELDGGVRKWVDDMPEAVLANQFPMTSPIYIDEELVERFFNQRLIREKEITSAIKRLSELGISEPQQVTGRSGPTVGRSEEHQLVVDEPNPSRSDLLDIHFPQRFDQCSPSFGWGCQYKKLCFGFVRDPLIEGYVQREPHHDLEREQLGLDLLQSD